MNQTQNNRWLLPDGIDEVLPPDAVSVELLRQQLLSLYDSWGYDLVMPAMIEFTDSLLTGTANALDRKTFTLVDQLTGKQMGLRSDMTPQVARIDAHKLANTGTSRFCYCGQLVHAHADGLNPSRSPLQIGAEIFGNASIEADIEVVCLMLETLQRIPLKDVSIDLGHVGIFRSLFEHSGLDKTLENVLFDMLQRKSIPELKAFLNEQTLTESVRNQFCQLALLNGNVDIIDEARLVFKDSAEECLAALDHIEAVAKGVQQRFPKVLIHCDLSELRGYEYHTGLVFAAFLPGHGQDIARGGRYDDIGSVFGVARPATGFSTDLLNLFHLSEFDTPVKAAILAPNVKDDNLQLLVKQLRDNGERVINDLSAGETSAQQQMCSQQIIHDGKQWVVNEVK
ncbi:MAG: ATP phosphoribosyltransferase regulatory subunit [Gammaproteobacteria bacterium]|nr:ATP phosphoribosyltransferase regulatory subunit [Gammaproteobacteria bacterium]MBT4449515.1 ATP phosphoribosyltransferase regulatory subunit [Gammaproteobacteria bacterium]MBT7045975.1 ATP phosphoribosyltransferase regulatory subunit [Gammaproteobacteria bacterium]